MKASRDGTELSLSATDLSGFGECTHKTVLELAVALRELDRPGENEIERRMLEKRGFEHEARVLEHLRQTRRELVTIGSGSDVTSRANAARETEAAMARGADVIAQGVLLGERWFGRPDFLLKVPRPSKFGDYGYEVADAKLANEAKARAVLQLCAYSELLTALQGAEPVSFAIAPGGPELRLIELRTADYAAYYRQAKRRFEAFVEPGATRATYPEPVEHCGVCHWWKRCEERRRADDHLSLVAGISARQRDRLTAASVARVSELGALDPEHRVHGIAKESLKRVREQARLQVAGRAAKKPLYELILDVEPEFGLDRLPEPSPGDLFLDLEGDAFVQGTGLEYLFGLVELTPDGDTRYHAYWSKTRGEEKRAFEAVVDRITRDRELYPDLHVFHFGHREADALKTLSCRHGTREAEVDRLLREYVLIDLHGIVKRSLRASVESYTLKQLEALYDFRRSAELRAAARAMQLFGWLLETGEGSEFEAEFRDTIARYNQDDCVSTARLRAWLEQRRGEFEQKTGRNLARPAPPQPKPDDPQTDAAQVASAILARLSDDPALDDREQRAERLLANLLDWHWRESKQTWWEHFRTRELAPAERLEDRAALAELRFVGVVGKEKKSDICRYEFPEQEHAIKSSADPFDPDLEKSAGDVKALGAGFIELKRGPSMTVHPRALVPGQPLNTKAHAARLLMLGRAVAEQGLAGLDSFRAARELLVRNPPRCGQKPQKSLLEPGQSRARDITRLVLSLDHSVLAVQGPPGSGKTHRAAEMIVELVAAGKRVGVTSNSHQVIKSLLRKVAEQAKLAQRAFGILHIDDKNVTGDEPFEIAKDYPRARARLDSGELGVVGGVSWAWCNEQLEGSIDVLVVDEAGQMSLANVLAVSLAAKSLVLFGDPAQLDQPQKGSHPPGADASALEHLLGDALTIPADRGVFLPQTRRLAPAICRFTSRVFYDGRLESLPGLDAQRIAGHPTFSGAGLRFVPVEHTGNTNQSDEEVSAVERIVASLLGGSTRFVDASSNERRLGPEDILVVAPYNAQVGALRAALPSDVQVGTVDKFQGAEAPIVIYSLTSSSADDAPRGLEFLYSLNRLNVATSRAKALVILTACPTLTRARCQTPRQMQLVNALCAYLEHTDSSIS